MAHARRKFHELWANHGSQLGEQALKFFVRLYEVEREVQRLASEERKAIRQEKAKPIVDALHQWLAQQRQKVPDGSATAKAIDYSLNRWAALTRYIDDGHDPYAYLRDVLERLPTQPASKIADLLPHRWQASATLA